MITGTRVDVARETNLLSLLSRAREIAAEAAAQSDLDLCLRKLRAGLIRLGIDRSGIWVVDDKDPTVLRGSWGTDWNGNETDEHHLVTPVDKIYGYDAIVAGERILTRRVARPDDPTAPPQHLRHLDDGPHNQATVALRADNSLVGVLAVDLVPSGNFLRTEQLAILDLMANVVAIVIARGKMADDLRSSNAELRQSEARYRTVSELASDYTWAVKIRPDGSTECEWVTGSVERITGYAPDLDAAPSEWFPTGHPDDGRLVRQNLQNVLAGQTTTLLYRIFAKDGELKWIRLHCRPEWDADRRRVVRIYAAARDVTDLRRAIEAVQQSEGSLRLLFESNPHPMWVVDLETYRFLAVNNAAIEHYGYTREEFLQMTIEEMRPPEDIPSFLLEIAQTGTAFRNAGRWRHRRKDGSLIDVEVSTHAIEFEGRKAGVAAVFDVTERLRVETAQRLLAEASRQFASALDEATVFTSLAHLVVPALADWCVVQLISSDGAMEPVAVVRADANRVTFGGEGARRGPIDPYLQTVNDRVIRAGKSELIAEVADALLAERAPDAADVKQLRDSGMTSIIVVPIFARSQVLGTVAFVAAESGRRFGPLDLDLAEDLVHRAALAADNLRLFAAERAARQEAVVARQEIVALYDATKAITASLDLATTLNNILDAVVTLSGSSAAEIALFDATGTVLTIEAARGQYAELLTGMRPSPQGVTGCVAASGEVFVSSDLRQDSRWVPVGGIDVNVMRSGLFVPLKSNDRVIGVLSAWTDVVGYFTPGHGRLLRGFSEQASLAVQRARDVAQRAEADEQIRFQATVLQHVRDSIIVADLRGQIIYWNEGASDIYGWSALEAVGSSIERIYLEGERDRAAGHFQTVVDRDGFSGVWQARRKDGSAIWADMKLACMRDPDGRPTGLLIVAKDVTERKVAEEALRRSEQNFRVLIERATDCIAVVNTDWTVRYASPRIHEIFGLHPEDLIGRRPAEVIQFEDPNEILNARDKIVKEPTLDHAFRFTGRHTDGTWRAIDATGINCLADPAVGGIVLSLRDVTERVRLEAQLRQAVKMEAVGQLAGGVAHDFNNLLTVITGYGELLLDQLGPDAAEYEGIKQIVSAGESAASLTRQLLAFSRRQVITLKDTDLNAIIEQLTKMLRRLIGEDIAFSTVLAPRLGLVRADTGQIEQILMNLAANARDAMPAGGKLTIETQNVDLDEEYVRYHPGSRRGLHVMVAISDTGIGMDESTRAHIFEPFFTTKGVGQGTGLGLAAVYGIVKQSEGHIDVRSQLGHGTTFKTYFPRVNAVASPPPTAKLRPVVARGTETILLVEDEIRVRVFSRNVLQSSGYTVIEADGGERALQLAEDHRGMIDLLVTDVVMPGMGGRQIAQRLLDEYPNLKVLFVSGYTDDVVVRYGVIEDGVAFLQKPFTPASLCQKVRDVLDGVRSAELNRA